MTRQPYNIPLKFDTVSSTEKQQSKHNDMYMLCICSKVVFVSDLDLSLSPSGFEVPGTH